MQSAIYPARGKKKPQVQICNTAAILSFMVYKWNPIICRYAIYPARPAFLVSTQCPAKFPITLKFPAGFAFLRRLMQQYILNFWLKVQNAHPQSIFRPTGDHLRFHSTRDIVCLSADP
jgi:hypothetical protein